MPPSQMPKTPTAHFSVRSLLPYVGFSAALFLGSATAIAQLSPPSYSGAEINATVLDPETQLPLEGVIVVADWRLVKYFGDPTERELDPSLVIAETTTDNSGRFSLPAWGPRQMPRATKGQYRLDPTQPWVYFWKPGYHVTAYNSPTPLLQVFQRDPAWTGDPLRKWAPSVRQIYLHKFKRSEAEYVEHLASMRPMFMKARCEWTKAPRATAAFINEGVRFTPSGSSSRIPALQELIEDERGRRCPDIVAALRPYLSPEALKVAMSTQPSAATVAENAAAPSPKVAQAAKGERATPGDTIGETDLARLREKDRVFRGRPSQAAIQTVQQLCSHSTNNVAAVFVVAPDVLSECVNSYDLAKVEFTPEIIEQLLVQHYGEDRVAPLWRFVASGSQSGGFPPRSIPRYQSRALFDRMQTDIRERNGNGQASTHQLVATDLTGIEPKVLELLFRVPLAAAGPIVWFLGDRRYAPAVEPLTRLASRISYDNNVNGILGAIAHNLGRIGTTESRDALIARARLLKQRPPSHARDSELASTLGGFVLLPANLQPDTPTFKALLPVPASDMVKNAHISYIIGRKDTSATADLVAYLPFGTQVISESLLKYGTSVDWIVARDVLRKLESAGPPDDARSSSLRRLDHAIANPATVLSARASEAAESAWRQAWKALDDEQERSRQLLRGNPQGFIAAAVAIQDRRLATARTFPDVREARSYTQWASMGYLQLAALARARAHDSKIAENLCKKAAAASADSSTAPLWSLRSDLCLADIQRFDFKDTKAALASYDRALRRLTAGNPLAGLLGTDRWLTAWIQHEVTYLKTGRQFIGAVTQEELSGLFGLLLLSAAERDANALLLPLDASLSVWPNSSAILVATPPQIKAALAALPPSQDLMWRTVGAWSRLPTSEDMTTHLRRNDPAGYASASVLAFVALVMAKPEVRDSADIRSLLPGIDGDVPGGKQPALRGLPPRMPGS